MKYFLLIVLLLGVRYNVHGQAVTTPDRYVLEGYVSDTAGKPLLGATVILLEPKNSSMVIFGRTNEQGGFTLRNIRRGTFILKISYIGMLLNDQLVQFDAQPLVNLGTIKLKPIAKELMEVVVKTARTPLTMRGDTIEYDARAFKVPPGSTVEDLLRKLPGVQVDQDGNIRAQGKEVSKVLVDGKSFFGTDPKLATKNLQAEVISKVQVFNDQTEKAKLTGVDDGKKEKAINLELKEEFKKGGFGKVTAGGGHDIVPTTELDGRRNIARGELKSNYNKFDAKKQFSLIGMTNNTNQTGLSLKDYQDFRGSNSFRWNDDADFGFRGTKISFVSDSDDPGSLSIPIGGGTGRGFTNNVAGGVNYNYDTKKTKISSNYYYSQTQLTLNSLRDRTTFLPGASSFLSTEYSHQFNFNGSHRASLRIQQEFDSLRSLVFIHSSRLGSGNVRLTSTQLLYRDLGTTLNTTTNINNRSQNNYFSMANTVIYRKKFKKKNRSFALSGTYQINTADADATQLSNTTFAQPPTSANDFLRNLRLDVLTNSQRSQYKANVLFMEPFAKKFYWESFYNFNRTLDFADRNTFDFTSDGGRGPLNDTLSRYYRNNYLYNRFGSGVRYSYKGINISAGGALQNFRIDGRFATDQTAVTLSHINRTYTTLLPNLSADYRFQNKTIYSFYNVNIRIPSALELQPIIDISNPLIVGRGNPNLLPQFDHSMAIGMGAFNPSSFVNYTIDFTYNYQVNGIVYRQDVDPTTFITRTLPVNITGGQTIGTYIGLNFPLKKTKATLDLGGNVNFQRSITPINNEDNITNTFNCRPRLRLNLTPSDNFTAYVNADVNFTSTRYSVNMSQNQQIMNQIYSVEANYRLPSNLFFKSVFIYRDFRNMHFGFNQQIPLWNAAVYKIWGKMKRFETQLSVFDLLNRNVIVSQSAIQNFTSNERILTLSRYFLLNISYNMRGISAKMQKTLY